MSIEKMTPRSMAAAKGYAAPFILRLLDNFSSEDLSRAVNENLSVTKWLEENPSASNYFRTALIIVPFLKAVLPNIRSKRWLRWFINNELQHKRLDLYAVFAYNPRAFKWLHRNMVRLSKTLSE